MRRFPVAEGPEHCPTICFRRYRVRSSSNSAEYIVLEQPSTHPYTSPFTPAPSHVRHRYSHWRKDSPDSFRIHAPWNTILKRRGQYSVPFVYYLLAMPSRPTTPADSTHSTSKSKHSRFKSTSAAMLSFRLPAFLRSGNSSSASSMKSASRADIATHGADNNSVSSNPPASSSLIPSVSFAPVTNPVQQVAEVIAQQKHEKESEAHKIFRDAAGHAPKGVLPQTVNPVRSRHPQSNFDQNLISTRLG